MEIAYLIEPTYISSTGDITGKSIRAYEVEVDTTNKLKYTFKSTGYVYTLKDNELVKKKTAAKLNKYLSYTYRNTILNSPVSSMEYWGCKLYSNPLLALVEKQRLLKYRCSLREGTITLQINRLLNNKKHLSQIKNSIDTTKIESQYPEWFI